MTSIISEFHSVTYRCKSTAVHISEINIRKNNEMAPQQHDTLPKSSDMEAKEPQKSSPISNLGTSVDSSPPHLPNQDAPGNMNEYEMGRLTVYDPSSDDSGSIQSNYDDQDEFHQSPLEQLQCTFGKNGLLPQSSPLSNYSPEKNRNCLPQGYRDTHDVSFPSTSAAYSRNMPSTSSAPPMFDRDSPFMAGLDMYPQPVPCHSCSYVAASKQEYDAHSSEHFEHKCTQCNYASRTEGRLKRHINDFHSDIPPESWSGSKSKKKKRSNSEESMDNCVTSSNGKSRKFKCKHCTFVCGKKDEFWKHAKIHMKPDKILQCPHCDFASEFKHHYEYHIANHFGRKPFKCSMCNYKCVNKSMLNSHMKSHSNVYQFRCATCSYVTKYCHSIKQHLKTKQGHEAGPILNQDGTPSSIQMIDVYGRRRGPRTKKRKTSENPPNNVVSSSSSSAPASQQIMPYSAPVPMLPPAIYPSMEYAPNFFMGAAHQLNSGYSMPIPLPSVHLGRYECSVCRYVTNDIESLNRHIITHAGEYPDIAKLYGINPEVLPNPQAFNSIMRQRNYLEQMESNMEKSVSPRNEKVSSSHGIVHGEKHQCDENELEARSIKSEDRSSPDYHRQSSSSPRNEGDSFKEFSSPSPAHSTISLPDFLASRKKHDSAKGSVIVTTEASSHMEVDSYRQPKGDDSPIDLSSPKSDSPKSDKSKMLETASEQQSPELKSSSPRGAESSNITSTNRHRRKGKAFKIDHYMQYDEQQELVKKECGEIQFIGSFKDETMEDIEHLWTEKIGQRREQSVEVIVSEKPSNVDFQRPDTSNRVYSSPHEQRSSPALRKTPQVQSQKNLNGNHQIPQQLSPKLDHSGMRVNVMGPQNEPAMMSVKDDDKSNLGQQSRYECLHCKTSFGDWFIYSVHMGFHGPQDPFTCKSCGCVTKDAVQFFIHLVRESH